MTERETVTETEMHEKNGKIRAIAINKIEGSASI